MNKIPKKSPTTRRRKNPILAHPVISVIIALALALGIILIFRAIQDQQAEASPDNSVTEQQSATTPTATTTQSATTSTNNPNAPDVVPGKTPAQYEGENVNNSATLTGTINTASVEDGTLIIRVTIDQLLSGTGTCTLTLTGPASQTLTYNANTIDNPSSASCEGFDIPTASLSSGEWGIDISINAGDRTGTLTGKVTI